MKATTLFLGLFFLVAACTQAGPATVPSETLPSELETPPADESLDGWRSLPLTDVNSGDSFTLGQFDTPVLIESFAVWCPTCTKQQRIMQEVHEASPHIVSISLDTDPNEDAATVRRHAEENGFGWRYAVSPPAVTRSLIDEFGTGVVNAPSAPVILLCPDGSAELLERGVKSAEELQQAAAGC